MVTEVTVVTAAVGECSDFKSDAESIWKTNVTRKMTAATNRLNKSSLAAFLIATGALGPKGFFFLSSKLKSGLLAAVVSVVTLIYGKERCVTMSTC